MAARSRPRASSKAKEPANSPAPLHCVGLLLLLSALLLGGLLGGLLLPALLLCGHCGSLHDWSESPVRSPGGPASGAARLRRVLGSVFDARSCRASVVQPASRCRGGRARVSMPTIDGWNGYVRVAPTRRDRESRAPAAGVRHGVMSRCGKRERVGDAGDDGARCTLAHRRSDLKNIPYRSRHLVSSRVPMNRNDARI